MSRGSVWLAAAANPPAPFAPTEAARTSPAGARPRAAATNSSRAGPSRPSAPASNSAVSLRAVALIPRSRSLIARWLTRAASASSSWVSPAASRSCRNSPPNLSPARPVTGPSTTGPGPLRPPAASPPGPRRKTVLTPSLTLCLSCARLRMVTARPGPRQWSEQQSPPLPGKEMTAMHQLTQLAADRHLCRLAHAEAQRPAQRQLTLARTTRRAERAVRPARPSGCAPRPTINDRCHNQQTQPQQPPEGHNEPHPPIPARPPPGRHPGRTGRRPAGRRPGRVRPARTPRGWRRRDATAPRAGRHCWRHARLADRPHRRGRRRRGRRRGSVLGPGPGRPPTPPRTQRLTCTDIRRPAASGHQATRLGAVIPPPSRAATSTTHQVWSPLPAQHVHSGLPNARAGYRRLPDAVLRPEGTLLGQAATAPAEFARTG